MAKNDKGLLTQFSTSGDLFAHQVQLLLVNTMRVFLVGAVAFVLSIAVLIYAFVTHYEWHVFCKTMLARVLILLHQPQFHLPFVQHEGSQAVRMTSAELVRIVTGSPELA
ncbi:MAG: hypothetical protein WCE58_04100 [Gallionella sp.]